MLLYYPISIFTFETFYISLACGKKKNENESYFEVSVLVDEKFVMTAHCAGSLKRVMRQLIRGN